MMAAVVHEDRYKHKGKTISEIKFTTKASVKIDQSRHRDRIILNKRLKIESLEEAETVLSAEEELEKVTYAATLLKQGKKVVALTILRRCFARDPNSSRNFLRNDGLQTLQSCLLSTDSEVLHAAAWCIINLAAGTSLSLKNMSHLSPLILQFLQGSDPMMQELCAWIVGNLAGDSEKHRNILLQQGCVAPLIALVSSQYHLSLEARSQSVLFALVNLARDKNYACVRCMLDSSLFNHLEMMLTTTSASCDLCFEIGWLTNYIYSRQETYLEHGDQYSLILYSVIEKLSQVICLEDKVQRDKVVLPYLHSIGNIIGFSPEIALIASNFQNFLPTLFLCLTCDIEFIQKESLWILVNFMAEPSCRVVVILQPRFLNIIYHLCESTDQETTLNAVYLLEDASKVSSWVCQYLIEHKILDVLLRLLTHSNLQILETALDTLMDVVIGTVQARTALLNAEEFVHLQSAASNEKYTTVMEKARFIIDLLK